MLTSNNSTDPAHTVYHHGTAFVKFCGLVLSSNGELERLVPAAGTSNERVGEREIVHTDDHASAVSLSYLVLTSLLYKASSSHVYPRQ